MDWLDKTTIELGAQVTSTLVALLALFIGLRNEARNQKIFERQLSLSQQAASAAAWPLLAIEREGYEDVKAVTITNHGPGTAARGPGELSIITSSGAHTNECRTRNPSFARKSQG